LNPETKKTRRISSGLETYMSIASSADGRRLVASIANPVANLWSVPILDRTAVESDVKPYVLPNARALSPRASGDSLYFLSSVDGRDGLWRWKDGQTSEIWKASEEAIAAPPDVSPDGRLIALALKRNRKQYVRVISADGSDARPPMDTLNADGSPSWSPDGKWIVTGGNDGKGDGLFKIPVAGGAPVKLVSGRVFNPVWSRELSVIVYTEVSVAASQPIKAVRPDGTGVADFPDIAAYVEYGDNFPRFLADGKSLVYVSRSSGEMHFILLDLTTKKSRVLARLTNSPGAVFDFSPDGKQIVFGRRHENADIVLIDLPKKP
jgi:Tol biopolymer transport system component